MATDREYVKNILILYLLLWTFYDVIDGGQIDIWEKVPYSVIYFKHLK